MNAALLSRTIGYIFLPKNTEDRSGQIVWTVLRVVAGFAMIHNGLDKLAVKIGEFDRGGKTRIPTEALDHDFEAAMTLTPYGIFVPELDELFLFFVASKLTADCIVDLIEQWWESQTARFSHIQKLVINQDNGIVLLGHDRVK